MMTMEAKQVAIYGSGGFGREVAWLVECCSSQEFRYTVECFIDDDETAIDAIVNNVPVFGINEAKRRFPRATVVGAIGAPRVRQKLMEKAAAAGFGFETIVHPRVERSEYVNVGRGTVICAGNILTTNITLGQHVQINLDCTVGHDVIMDDYVTLAPGVHVSGYVHFGKRVYVGTGAAIINGTQEKPIIIGDDAVIGAGGCVTKSVPAGMTVVGVPAKPLQPR